MRVSLEWLKEYVEIPLTPKELVDALTMLGLEVEGQEELGTSLNKVVTARILEVKPHPNADRLKLCVVDVGGKEYQVVCGAPNVRKGLVSALALPGATLPNGMVIKEAKIRGELSFGMLAAEDELGLTDDHTGIIELSEDLQSGVELDTIKGIRDVVLDVSITPNRGDCNCVVGIAREVSFIVKSPLKLPSYDMLEEGEKIEKYAQIEIEDPEGCPRYCAGMIQGIQIRQGPFWMRYRIHKSGMRAINNIVDVTNYVMLELGQPLHAFDYHKIRGAKIVVKKAQEGERFQTLDGSQRLLSRDVLLICDGEGPVAVAGIMGGLNSEISESTNTVLLESAFFDPITIRKGSKHLGLQTEASYRFERRIDIGNVENALRRALELMRRLSGGVILKGTIDAYVKEFSPPTILLDLRRAESFVGMPLEREKVKEILSGFGMEVQGDGASLKVIPPTHRPDITIPEDVMEEIARGIGYENIPIHYPKISARKVWDTSLRRFSLRVKEVMAGLGFNEVITFSFISPVFLEIFKVPTDPSAPGHELRKIVRLKNPLSIEQSVMRTTLLPGLLNTVRYNLYQGVEGLKIFELGEVFFDQNQADLPDQRQHVAALVAQPFLRDSWYQKEREADIWDIKGVVETLLNAIGIREVRYEKARYPGFDPALTVDVYHGERWLLRLGRIERGVLKEFDLLERGDIYAFEGDVGALREARPRAIGFVELPKYPAATRDISIVLERDIESKRVEEVIKERGAGFVESLYLFDLYEGEKLEKGKKALGYRITFRSKERTLEGQEINELMERIISGLKENLGARLRE